MKPAPLKPQCINESGGDAPGMFVLVAFAFCCIVLGTTARGPQRLERVYEPPPRAPWLVSVSSNSNPTYRAWFDGHWWVTTNGNVWYGEGEGNDHVRTAPQ